MKASEVLREMRAVLFERGWHQGHYEGGDGSVCIAGACNLVETGCTANELDRSGALGFVSEVVAPLHIADFNDSNVRKFSDVIEALEKAEKLALIAEES